ncbi:MAG: hypothetical protein ACOYYS_22580 [Chloroflexota bacterium]
MALNPGVSTAASGLTRAEGYSGGTYPLQAEMIYNGLGESPDDRVGRRA